MPGFWGSGLYACSSAPVPEELVAWMIHNNAEPDDVPLEVMIGAPDENPKVLLEFAVEPTCWK